MAKKKKKTSKSADIDTLMSLASDSKKYVTKSDKEAILQIAKKHKLLVSKFAKLNKAVDKKKTDKPEVQADDSTQKIIDWFVDQADHGKLRKWDYNSKSLRQVLDKME